MRDFRARRRGLMRWFVVLYGWRGLGLGRTLRLWRWMRGDGRLCMCIRARLIRIGLICIRLALMGSMGRGMMCVTSGMFCACVREGPGFPFGAPLIGVLSMVNIGRS